ncbi:MAG: protein translocase subunit SecD [Candidatus Pacebacteria bacterium]|nr:protein translocase subunit SecD [Candidatus Paceibacterota bacterium]
MSKKRVCITVFFIFALAFVLGNLVYPKFLNISKIPDIPFRLGLDLQGGTHLVYEADISGIEEKNISSSMEGLRDVIERRVNLFGVQEPVVQTQEAGYSHRLIVELAGVKDPAEAIKMIGQTPFLEFREQKENYEEIVNKNTEIIKEEEPDLDQIEDPFQSTELNGKYLKDAQLDSDPTTSLPTVSIQFDDEGARIFKELTERNVGKLMPIYIDGVPVSIPRVQEAIVGGKAQITGSFTYEEAKTLARNLKAGALPVPINLVSQQSVGPTLGAISLAQSLKAGIMGFLAVIAFMIIFYRLPGLLASLALAIYIIIILFLFKIIPVTLTLAGIGGLILSIGMAVDANILIFTRMREELKEGKDFSYAVENGFNRAWASIRDGNLTTIIVALILFVLGTSFIKGFALTLTIGILMSMVSAVVITKSFLRIFKGSKLEKIKWLW